MSLWKISLLVSQSHHRMWTLTYFFEGNNIDATISHLRFYLSGRSNRNHGIELEDGSIIDSEGLQYLKHLSQLIEYQEEIREGNVWLENLPELLKFPNGLLNDTFPVFGTQFVSLLQSNEIDTEIQPITLRVAHIKCLAGSRILYDSFLCLRLLVK